MKRAPGSGSIEILPSGKARISFMRHGRRRRMTLASEAIARRTLASLDQLRQDGEIATVEGASFADTFRRFMDARELGGRVRGIPEERALARARIEPAAFFKLPARAVRRADLVAWIDALLGSKALVGGRRPRREASRTLSRETVLKALRLVRACFAWAVERELVQTNPAAEVRVPRHARPEDCEDAWTFLELAEIEQLFASPLSERDRALFALAIYAGPRQGELFALRWEDVHEDDAARPRVVIRRARNGPTKGGKIREVPLFAPAIAAVRRWRELSCGENASGLVFPSPDGTAYGKKYNAGWPDKPFRNARAELVVAEGVKSRAGIRRDVRFHDLRHTCASHLVMGSWGSAWSLEQVRDFLGHSTIRMTERYAHLGADSLHAKARETVGAPQATLTALPTVAHEEARTLSEPERVKVASDREKQGETFEWAMRDLNTRLPPCEGGTLPLS